MNAKAKGNAFERKICVELSLWWTKGKNDNVFWRTANSGGRATTRKKAKKEVTIGCGDIEAIDPIGDDLMKIFTFELKNGYNKSTFADLLDAPSTAKQQQYAHWFEKVERERKHAGAYSWALIVQRTRRLPLIFFPAIKIDDFFGNASPLIYLYQDFRNYGIVGTHLSNFFKIDPKEILKLKG